MAMAAPSHNILLTGDALRGEEAFRREWLVTNNLGGYASASVTTANTRRYHGLLVAALNPPVGRAVLLSKLEEALERVLPEADSPTVSARRTGGATSGSPFPSGEGLGRG